MIVSSCGRYLSQTAHDHGEHRVGVVHLLSGWLAKNLSNVAVPVNADIPADIDVSFTDEYDETASLIGARGIGELGATGVDAAVAAAVHDAVGVRVRDLPILPWKVLAG